MHMQTSTRRTGLLSLGRWSATLAESLSLGLVSDCRDSAGLEEANAAYGAAAEPGRSPATDDGCLWHGSASPANAGRSSRQPDGSHWPSATAHDGGRRGG